MIVDPSAASFIAQLRHDGVFTVRKAKNGVLPGIQLVARYLKEGRLLMGAGCSNAIREFSQYRWQENEEKDLPWKENDHAMDDIRYFCATIMRRDDMARSIIGGMESETSENVAYKHMLAGMGEG